MGGIALVLFILQIIIRIKIYKIDNQIRFPLKTPYDFTIKSFDSVRNPNTDKEVVPTYLRDGFKKAKVTKRRVINSHESLFWLGSDRFMIKCLHFILITQVIWPIIFFSNYSYELNGPYTILIAFVSMSLILINILYIFPSNLMNFSRIRNIEMLKNEQIINEVIMEQKFATEESFIKFFRL